MNPLFLTTAALMAKGKIDPELIADIEKNATIIPGSIRPEVSELFIK